MDFGFPDTDAVNARGAAPLWLRQTSAGPPKREMQDTCLFVQAVKDGTSRRFVRRLEARGGWESNEEFDGVDGTASWQSWRSGIESCTGRSRADSELSILSNASARAMHCLIHGGEVKEDLGRRESQGHLLVPMEQKRRIVKPLSELADGNLLRSGRHVRRSSNHSSTSITFSRALVSDASSHPPSDSEVDP